MLDLGALPHNGARWWTLLGRAGSPLPEALPVGLAQGGPGHRVAVGLGAIGGSRAAVSVPGRGDPTRYLPALISEGGPGYGAEPRLTSLTGRITELSYGSTTLPTAFNIHPGRRHMAANGAGALRVPVVLGDAGEDDSDVYVLGLRASADNEAWSLLLMECDDAEDEQEIARGMDTYCLVVDPGQRTAYGWRPRMRADRCSPSLAADRGDCDRPRRPDGAVLYAGAERRSTPDGASGPGTGAGIRPNGRGAASPKPLS